MAKRKNSNVKSLFGTSTISVPKCDPEIIETLERLLARARDGQILGLAYAAVECNGWTGRGWSGSADTALFVAAIARLQFDFQYADMTESENSHPFKSPA